VQLRCEDVTCDVDPRAGGRVTALRVGELDVLLTPDDDPRHYGMFPMAPWAGRTRDGRFRFGDVTHHLPINQPPHAIHGTVRDRPWTLEDANPLHARLSCDLGTAWPFDGWAEQTVTVFDDRLELTLSVQTAGAPMPASLGWHPWFRKPTKVELKAAAMYERDDDHITLRTRQKPMRGPWDDCFTDLTRPPKLTWVGQLALVVESDCPCVVVYDEPDAATCVEPQTAPPDALNHDDAAIVTPDEPLRASMTWRWTRL